MVSEPGGKEEGVVSGKVYYNKDLLSGSRVEKLANEAAVAVVERHRSGVEVPPPTALPKVKPDKTFIGYGTGAPPLSGDPYSGVIDNPKWFGVGAKAAVVEKPRQPSVNALGPAHGRFHGTHIKERKTGDSTGMVARRTMLDSYSS